MTWEVDPVSGKITPAKVAASSWGSVCVPGACPRRQRERTFPGRKDNFIHGNTRYWAAISSKSEFGQDNGLTRNTGKDGGRFKTERGSQIFKGREFFTVPITTLKLQFYPSVSVLDGTDLLTSLATTVYRSKQQYVVKSCLQTNILTNEH